MAWVNLSLPDLAQDLNAIMVGNRSCGFTIFLHTLKLTQPWLLLLCKVCTNFHIEWEPSRRSLSICDHYGYHETLGKNRYKLFLHSLPTNQFNDVVL